LDRCLKALQPGDASVVWKLDRLGRSLHDLIAKLDDLKRRNVKFQSLTEAVDTATPTGRAMWQMLGILAELERNMIAERTAAGRAAARKRGVVFGAPRKLNDKQVLHALHLREQEAKPVPEIAALLGVSRHTVYRALNAFAGG
jgi:DNA invertase Pin-like site-specific DNA recombinase